MQQKEESYRQAILQSKGKRLPNNQQPFHCQSWLTGKKSILEESIHTSKCLMRRIPASLEYYTSSPTQPWNAGKWEAQKDSLDQQ